MPHTIEPASSGRAKCRACGRPIGKGELRLGERLPNPFADEGEMTLWFHLDCAAYKRPEPLLEALGECTEGIDRQEWLADIARKSLEHRRLPRIDGAERAPSGRASCRSCREKIAKDEWRLRLVFYDEGRFSPGGFIHASCAGAYLETSDTAELINRVERFTPDFSDEDRAAVTSALAGS